MGQVVIEQMERFLEDDQKDNPPQTVITIAEARKLILDWIATRDKVVRGAAGQGAAYSTDGQAR